MGKGEKLNQRVWKLFAKAGFKTKPNDGNPDEEKILLDGRRPRTVDLCAWDEDLGIKIIGWNKARNELKESFSVHMHDYKELQKIYKADSVLFVSTDKEPEEEDFDYAQKNGMRVWGKEELDYYEALVEAIGEYAKYEIINSFGIETKEEKLINHVLALKFEQPITNSDTDLYLFTATPETLLKTCVVLRKARKNKDAYQRILNRKRLKPIKDFVIQSGALLPTNIVIHLSDDVTSEELEIPAKNIEGKRVTISKKNVNKLVLLKIPNKFASLELIDGQHRLFGFVLAEPATRKNFNLAVIGIAKIEPELRTKTFVAINDKAKKVDPNLVAYLKFNPDEILCQQDNELMAIKIVVELNKISPFKNKIKLLDVGNQKITLKGFAGYDLKGLIGRSGMLRKHYNHNSNEYVKILRIYFSTLKSTFPDQWNDPEKYIIFTNKGISAFLKLFRSILKTEENKLDQKVIASYLNALKKNKKSWDISSLKKTYVGSQGWKEFHRDLVKAIKKEYPKFKE